MPLVKPFRYVSSTVSVSYVGCQYLVDGATLAITGNMTLALDGAIYTAPGTYALFDWSGGGVFSGSTAEIAYISNFQWTNPPSEIDTTVAPIFIIDLPNKRVLMQLSSKKNLSTQYVDANLAIPSRMLVVLNAAFFPVAGEYVLFEVAGTISGDPANITCSPLASGLVAQAPYIVGNQVRVLLVNA